MVIRKWVLEQILFVLVSRERSVSGEVLEGNSQGRGVRESSWKVKAG